VNGATSYSWVAPGGWTGTSTISSITFTANSASGNMSVTALNGCGASSALSQTITVKPLPNITTTLTGGMVITSNQSGATYQWLNCTTGSTITNATSQSYTATSTGSYAVVVNLNGCSSTSSCVSITSLVGITELSESKQPAIYPVPNDGNFFIQSSVPGAYNIVNELGQIIRSFELTNLNQYTVRIENFEKGIYFILGSNNNNSARQKIIVVK
jgi:PKD-like domain/Secretion system C-terminal sorting domain